MQELSREEAFFVDDMAGKILASVVNNSSGALNNDTIRALAQSSYRAALITFEVRKDYIAVVEPVVETQMVGFYPPTTPEMNKIADAIAENDESITAAKAEVAQAVKADGYEGVAAPAKAKKTKAKAKAKTKKTKAKVKAKTKKPRKKYKARAKKTAKAAKDGVVVLVDGKESKKATKALKDAAAV